MKILIAGAGLTGCTLARLLAEYGNSVTIVEKNEFIGGVCYDYLSDDGSCYVHKFGPHIFHTLDENVWQFVNRFSEFNEYRHSYAAYNDGFYVFPINLHTISQVFGKKVHSKEQALKLIKKGSRSFDNPQNFEEAAINDLGEILYEKFIKNYTEKQWKCQADRLPIEIYNRVKIRFNFNDDCFQNQFQGTPKYGYSNLMRNMLNNRRIVSVFGEDFFKMKNLDQYGIIIFTGYVPGSRYRSTEFIHYKGKPLDWPCVNFTGKENKTRTTDFNILHGNPDKEIHYLCDEIPVDEKENSCLYPINTAEGLKSYEKAKKDLQAKYNNLVFCGRMAEYRYFDMDKAVDNAMEFVKNF